MSTNNLKREDMKYIIRPDFIIKKDYIICKNNENIRTSIAPDVAIALMLYDGYKTNKEIDCLLKEYFKENYVNMLWRMSLYDNFFIEVNKAKNIFGDNIEFEYDIPAVIKAPDTPHIANSIEPLKTIELYMTNKCIRRCKYCYVGPEQYALDKEEIMDISKMKDIIYQAFVLGAKCVLITGGEPFLCEEIYEIINYADSLDMISQILTKSKLNEDKLKLINKSKLDLCLSVDSHIEEVTDYLVGTKGYMNDVNENIEILKRLNIPFDISITVNKINKDNILDTILYFKDKGAVKIFTTFYECENETEQNKELYMSIQERKDWEIEWKKIVKEHNLGRITRHKSDVVEIKDITEMSCAIGRTKLCVRFDGKYIFCEKLAMHDDIDLGTVYEYSLLQQLNSEKLRKYIHPSLEEYKGTKCSTCEKFDLCNYKNGCIYNSLMKHNNLFKPMEDIKNVCIE